MRKECVHTFLHEKGWAWAVGGCSRAWEEMLFTMHFNRELTKEIREWNYDDYWCRSKGVKEECVVIFAWWREDGRHHEWGGCIFIWKRGIETTKILEKGRVVCWADPDLAWSKRRHLAWSISEKRRCGAGLEVGWDYGFGHETVEGAARIGFGPLAKERSVGCHDGLGKSMGFNSIWDSFVWVYERGEKIGPKNSWTPNWLRAWEWKERRERENGSC